MRESRQSRSSRQPMILSIAVAFAFAAVFGGPIGEQLSQASQAAPVVTSITFEDRFVRLILPGNVHGQARRHLPLIVHLHGSVPFPNAADGALTNSGYRALPGKYDGIVAAPMGTLHPQLGFFLERHRGLLRL